MRRIGIQNLIIVYPEYFGVPNCFDREINANALSDQLLSKLHFQLIRYDVFKICTANFDNCECFQVTGRNNIDMMYRAGQMDVITAYLISQGLQHESKTLFFNDCLLNVLANNIRLKDDE